MAIANAVMVLISWSFLILRTGMQNSRWSYKLCFPQHLECCGCDHTFSQSGFSIPKNHTEAQDHTPFLSMGPSVVGYCWWEEIWAEPHSLLLMAVEGQRAQLSLRRDTFTLTVLGSAHAWASALRQSGFLALSLLFFGIYSCTWVFMCMCGVHTHTHVWRSGQPQVFLFSYQLFYPLHKVSSLWEFICPLLRNAGSTPFALCQHQPGPARPTPHSVLVLISLFSGGLFFS